ncbi:MAG: hypothetical protein Q4Q19_03380 [Methanobrevibacter sp.]|nr:hypothetical protein [Methanobrevibacter sp.]
MTKLWERQKRERDNPYYWKHIYIHEIKSERTLSKVISYIEKLPKEGKSGELFRYKDHFIKLPTLPQLEKASERYKWNQALADYTNYLEEKDEKRREEKYSKTSDMVCDVCTELIKGCKGLTKEIKQGDYAPSTKAQYLYTIARTIDLANKNHRLNNNRSTSKSESTEKISADVKFLKESDEVNMQRFLDAFK